jgi:carbonic anhydrase
MRHILLALCVVAGAPARTPAQNPDAIWQSLMDGNRAYVAGKITFDHLADQRHHSADHQNPPVTVLSCSDSRVPPELIFNRSIDQLFVIRVAGNVAADFELASMEFAIANGYTKLIVVLGHDSCGAVKAAMSPGDAPTPSLGVLVQRIRASWAQTPPTLDKAIAANARASSAYLLTHSKVIRDAVDSKRVAVVTAVYHLDSGVVEQLK